MYGIIKLIKKIKENQKLDKLKEEDLVKIQIELENDPDFQKLVKLNENIVELGGYCKEFDILLRATLSHNDKIVFDIEKLNECLLSQEQRDLNKKVCKRLVELNDELLKTFQEIINLKNNFLNSSNKKNNS